MWEEGSQDTDDEHTAPPEVQQFTGSEDVQIPDLPGMGSYIGQAVRKELLRNHGKYQGVCWSVSHGETVEFVQTPPQEFYEEGIGEKEAENHSNFFPVQMGDIMKRARHYVDFATLSPPTGSFLTEICKALKTLAEEKKEVTVRFLCGNIIGMSVNNHKFLSELVNHKEHKLPNSQEHNLKIWCGSWRKGMKSWNHAKIIAIDGKYLFTGGHNVWDDHYLKRNPVRDASAEFKGQVAIDAHKFLNRQWKYIQKKEQERLQSSISGAASGAVPGLFSHVVGIAHYPKQKKGEEPELFPPMYQVPEGNDISLEEAVRQGQTPMLTLGRFGALHHEEGDANPSDSAFVAAFRAAKKTIKLCVQDLGPLAIPKALGGPTAIPGGEWPLKYLSEIARAIYERGVSVEIILSNPASVPANLRLIDACYGNGWDCNDVAAEILKVLHKEFPSAEHQGDDSMKSLVENNLHIAFLRTRGGEADWKQAGGKAGNHAKFFIVDDIAYYIGSQNLYIANLAEWGVLVDDKVSTARVLRSYWEVLWEHSWEKVSESDKDVKFHSIWDLMRNPRIPKPPIEYTEAELENILALKKSSRLGGALNTLTVWVKRGHKIPDMDGADGGDDSSDSYVFMQILDEDNKEVCSSQQTRVIVDGGANPHWNETFDFDGLIDPQKLIIVFTVLDQDTLWNMNGWLADWLVKDDVLGHASVAIKTLKESGEWQYKELKIGGTKHPDAKISVGFCTRGTWRTRHQSLIHQEQSQTNVRPSGKGGAAANSANAQPSSNQV